MADYYPNKAPAPVTVAAAGSTQGNAALLTSGVLNLVTGNDGTKGVILPAAAAGEKVRVYSSAATSGLKVYPPTSGTINGGSANASVTMEGKTLAYFENADGTNWAASYTVDS